MLQTRLVSQGFYVMVALASLLGCSMVVACSESEDEDTDQRDPGTFATTEAGTVPPEDAGKKPDASKLPTTVPSPKKDGG